jgi:hypothetical protein
MCKNIEYSKALWATLARIKNIFNYIFGCSMAYKSYVFSILSQPLCCHEFLFAGDTTLCSCANKYNFECIGNTHYIYFASQNMSRWDHQRYWKYNFLQSLHQNTNILKRPKENYKIFHNFKECNFNKKEVNNICEHYESPACYWQVKLSILAVAFITTECSMYSSSWLLYNLWLKWIMDYFSCNMTLF